MDRQLILDTLIGVALTTDDHQPFVDAVAILHNFKPKHKAEEIAYARFIRELAFDRISKIAARDVDAAQQVYKAIETILFINAKDDLDSYLLYLEWRREPEKRFYQPRRHVLLPAVRAMQELEDHQLDFLSISFPPRVGKSTLSIFFLTWVMGRHPHRANVMSGHSDKLTKGFHQEVYNIITDTQYTFNEIFANTFLAGKSFADETIRLAGSSIRFPTLTCRSVDGTLTGAVEVGRDALLYCDDLVSDREQALSTERMEKLYSTYLNQLRDRKLEGAKELHVGTRWVPNDVIGRIFEEHEHDKYYKFLSIPALNEDGESNFVYLYNLGFSTEYYRDMEKALTDAGEQDSWLAKYMATPTWIGGLMFGQEELRWYDGSLPTDDEGKTIEPDGVIAVCDTKDQGKDYACLPIAYIYGSDYYIHDVICDNSLPAVVEPRIVDALIRNDVGMARFESNSAGGRVADDVSNACREQDHSIDIRKKFSTENKETRILTDSMWIKEHCLFRSDEPTSDYKRFISMLTHYTTEGKNKHDDAPDAMSMLKRFVSSSMLAEVTPMRRLA